MTHFVCSILAALSIALATSSASAQVAGGDFADGANDAKIHVASKFSCPQIAGHFERDAVGQSDPETSADFCAYSARDGVYATITLKPLAGTYDAKTSFAHAFEVQENTGGKKVFEAALKYPGRPGTPPLDVYTRSYETSALEDLHYRVLYAGSTVGNWAVEVTVEYAETRDDADEKAFLDTVYRAAVSEIPANPAPEAAAAPPLAGSPHPR